MWINTSTQQTYHSHTEIRAAFPQTSLPTVLTDEVLATLQVLPVADVAVPAFNPLTHRAAEQAPAFSNGRWERQWTVVALNQEEQGQQQQALMAWIVQRTQQRLDDFAKTRNYDGVLSLCTYATSSVPKFALEAQRGVDLRDATWATLYQILADVEAQTRPIPSGFADIEADLPALEWP